MYVISVLPFRQVGTRVLAPFVRHEGGMTIHWDRWEFNNHLPTRVPEEGVSRMVSMSKSAEQDSMVRYGLALQLEHGFMTTAQGQMNFRLNLQQLTNAVTEGTEMGVTTKLLNASDTFDNFYERTDVGLGAFALDDVLRQETALYCAPQKRRDGMLAIKQYIDETLQQRGQRGGFVMVVPQGLKDQINSNEFEAVSMINKSADGPRNEVFSKMGLGQVYESRGFYVDSARPTMDLHYTPSYKGEFNFLTYKHLMDLNPQDYRTSFAAIQVYDEDRDNFVKIDALTALRKCGLFHWPRGGRDANHDDYRLTTIGSNWFGGNQTWGQFLTRHARQYRTVLLRFLEAKGTQFKQFVAAHFPNVAISQVGRNAGFAGAAPPAPGAHHPAAVSPASRRLDEEVFGSPQELQYAVHAAPTEATGTHNIKAYLDSAKVLGSTMEKRTTIGLAMGLLAGGRDRNVDRVIRISCYFGTIDKQLVDDRLDAIDDASQNGALVGSAQDSLTDSLLNHVPAARVEQDVSSPIAKSFLSIWRDSGVRMSRITSRGVSDVLGHAVNNSGVGAQQGRLLLHYGVDHLVAILSSLARDGNDDYSGSVNEAKTETRRLGSFVGACVCGVGDIVKHVTLAANGDTVGLCRSILSILDPTSVQVGEADRRRFKTWFEDNREFYTHWPSFYEANHVPVTVAALRYLVLNANGLPGKVAYLVSWTALVAEMHRVALSEKNDAKREELVTAVQAIITLSAYSRMAFLLLVGSSGLSPIVQNHANDFSLSLIDAAVKSVTSDSDALENFIQGMYQDVKPEQLRNLAIEVSSSFTSHRNQGIPDTVYDTAEVKVPERTGLVDQVTYDAILDLLPIDGRFPEWCINNDIPPPIGALLLRPHWGHETGVTIGMLPNGRSAYTFFGHPNFEVNDNAVRKVYYGHFTWYSTTVVWNPKGVVRVFDTRSRRYIGGGGTKIYPWSRQGMESYHQLTARSTPKYDMFCFPVPPCWTPHWWYMDITGRVHPEVTSRRYKVDEYHYPQAELMAGIVGFTHGSRARSYEEKALRRPGNNTICCQGHQVMFDGRKERIVLSQAHWGQDVYPGCGKVRAGYYSQLRTTTHDGTAVMTLVA